MIEDVFKFTVYKNEDINAKFIEKADAIKYAESLINAMEYIFSIEVKDAANKTIWSSED